MSSQTFRDQTGLRHSAPHACRRAQFTALAISLACACWIGAGSAEGSITPAAGTATIDGSILEWDTSVTGPDFFAPMHTGGDLTKPLLSNLFLRYDSINQILYGLVYRPEGGVSQTTGDAWFKEYTSFGSNHKLFDATIDLSAPGAPDFSWVFDPLDSTKLLGYCTLGKHLLLPD